MQRRSIVKIVLPLIIVSLFLLLSRPPVFAQDYVNTVHEGDIGVFPTINESFPGIIGAYFNIPFDSDYWGPSYGHYLSVSFDEEDDGSFNPDDPLNLFKLTLADEDISQRESGKVNFYMPVIPGVYTMRAYQANANPNANLGNLYNYGYTTSYDAFSDIIRTDYSVVKGPATFGNLPASLHSGDSFAVTVRNISSPVSWIGVFPAGAKTFEECLYAQYSSGHSSIIYDYLPEDISAGQYCLKVVSYILGNIHVSTSQNFEVISDAADLLQPGSGLQIRTTPYNRDLGNLIPKKLTLTVQCNNGSNKLDWNSRAFAQNITGYLVYKSTQSGQQNDTPETPFPIKGTTYTDTKITPGVTYYYIVIPVYADNSFGAASNEVSATAQGGTVGSKGSKRSIVFTLDNPQMSSNGVPKDIDSGYGTAPLIKDGRTFIPIRALIEEMGGTLAWTGAESKITIQVNGKTIDLWLGKNNIRVDGIDKTMDVAPYISATGRTMLPLRFVAENLGCLSSWNDATKSITIAYDTAAAKTPPSTDNVASSVSLPNGVPSSLPAPTISNLELLDYDDGIPYFRAQVTMPASVLTLDQERPTGGWVNLETQGKTDDGEWGTTGGGGGHLDVVTDEENAVPGKTNTFYIAYDLEDEGGLTETVINATRYTYRLRFGYTYYYGDGPGEWDEIYSPWSNELSGQSESYYRSDEE